ncbi:MAG: hypothetical protein LBT09_11400 [Planctomycetaceae bacterium]|nr:hypothetical protein [Planctomycetaceae bacterium]
MFNFEYRINFGSLFSGEYFSIFLTPRWCDLHNRRLRYRCTAGYAHLAVLRG